MEHDKEQPKQDIEYLHEKFVEIYYDNDNCDFWLTFLMQVKPDCEKGIIIDDVNFHLQVQNSMLDFNYESIVEVLLVDLSNTDVNGNLFFTERIRRHNQYHENNITKYLILGFNSEKHPKGKAIEAEWEAYALKHEMFFMTWDLQKNKKEEFDQKIVEIVHKIVHEQAHKIEEIKKYMEKSEADRIKREEFNKTPLGKAVNKVVGGATAITTGAGKVLGIGVLLGADAISKLTGGKGMSTRIFA